MKKILLAVVTLGMLNACSCHGLKVDFSRTEPLAEDTRELKDFERIELLGSLDVKYAQADSFSVVVSAPAKVINDVETRVEGNKLVVGMKGSNRLLNFGVADASDVTVYVTSPDFSLNGSGDIEFDDIVCDEVIVSLVGSGDVELKHVKTQYARVNLVGSGDVKVAFDSSGAVEAQLTGSGDITLSGNVKSFQQNVRGSGDMNTKQLKF